MFGGVVTVDDTTNTSTNNVYIFNVTHNTIVSQSITLSQYYCIYCIVQSNINYLNDLTHCKLLFFIQYWESVKPGAIPSEGLWPEGRQAHASTTITGDSTSPTLVVIGGLDKRNQLVNDCLLLDKITTSQCSWKKVRVCVCKCVYCIGKVLS